MTRVINSSIHKWMCFSSINCIEYRHNHSDISNRFLKSHCANQSGLGSGHQDLGGVWHKALGRDGLSQPKCASCPPNQMLRKPANGNILQKVYVPPNFWLGGQPANLRPCQILFPSVLHFHLPTSQILKLASCSPAWALHSLSVTLELIVLQLPTAVSVVASRRAPLVLHFNVVYLCENRRQLSLLTRSYQQTTTHSC